MTRGPSQSCAVCQSLFIDGDCIHVPGVGTVPDPYLPEVVPSSADGNMVSVGPNGVMGRLPSPYDDPPAVLVYDTIDQSIAFNAAQTLFFARSGYDTDQMYDPDEPSRLTFRTPGLYLVTLNVCWFKHETDDLLGDTAVFLRTNGDLIVAVDSQAATTASGFARHSIHSVIPAQTAGEYVEARAMQTLRVDAETPVNARILAVRQSPIFTATFLRTLDDLTVFGR